MSIVKRIRKSCLLILGVQAEHWEDVWDSVKELSEAFGEREVAEAFDTWAEDKRGSIITKPVSEFVRIAPGLIQGTFNPDPSLVQLVNDLVDVSRGEVTFGAEQQSALRKLLKTYSAAEIKTAFADHFNKVDGDDFLVKRAGKDFIEKAEQIITYKRREAENVRKTYEQIREITAREQAKAASELAEIEKRRQEEESFVDPLFDGAAPTQQGT